MENSQLLAWQLLEQVDFIEYWKSLQLLQHSQINYLVISKQIWNFSGSQKVVDENEKLFVGDLSVGHEEDGAKVLEAGLLVKVGQVEFEVGTAVTFSQSDLKQIVISRDC